MMSHVRVARFDRLIMLGMGIVLAIGALLSTSTRAQIEKALQTAVLLAPASFETDLRGWGRIGQAEFAADDSWAHDGHRAARITIAPNITPSYQQLRQDFARDVQVGDVFRASVWARSEGIQNVRGPYLALEFNNADDQRVAIAHSGSPTDTGPDGWRQYTAEGTVPAGTHSVRVSLVLHAHGTGWFAAPELVRTERPVPWPELGDSPRSVTIQTNTVVQPHFAGVGFHAYHHIFPAPRTELDEVIIKRWRELCPSFARINHEIKWDRAKLDQVAEHLQYMKDTGTELYLTTWDPPISRSAAERADHARRVVDHLEYLVRDKKLTNIRWYCMTNEMTLGRWGALLEDLPTFQAYHQAIYDEMKSRHLEIGLLATDAAPAENWGTLNWAARNMAPITSIYGGHHYFSDRALEDEHTYDWFLNKTRWAVDLAKKDGKEFLLGEFGSKQDGRTVDGKMRDVCIYFDGPQEPLVAIQLAEGAIAAMNAGTYAMGYWTFMDVPDDYAPGYLNKWGLFRCSGNDRSTRTVYYGYALLTRYFRGPGAVVATTTNDPRLRVVAVRHPNNNWSIAIVNRNAHEVPIRLTLPGLGRETPLRKYVYDPRNVVPNAFGDLPGPEKTVQVTLGVLEDTLGAGTLTVYTSDFHRGKPETITGLKVERSGDGRDHLTWSASSDPDLCYYRVFRDNEQIGSTIATSFTTMVKGTGYKDPCYHVAARGNASE